MNNIGFVVYKKGNEPGMLMAQWEHSDYGKGTGIAKGSQSDGYEGEYTIQYFDNNGIIQAERDLIIKKEGDSYHLSWFKENKKTAEGIGKEISCCLCVGYHDI